MDSPTENNVLKYFSLLIFCLLYASADEKSGKWDIEVSRVGFCEEGSVFKEELSFKSARITKKDRSTYTWSTELAAQREISNELRVHVNFHSFGNGGYRPNFMEIDFDNLCDTAEIYFPALIEGIINAANATSCPVPPGTYNLADISIDGIQSMKHIPTFVYGKYRLKIDIVDPSDNTVGCIYLYFDIVPKKKGKKKKQSS